MRVTNKDSGTFIVTYTELKNDVERESSMTIETKDIKRTMDQFVRNRVIEKIDARQVNVIGN
jgi:hypothetical protein|tara:strand:+ start:824 stop:1009 length:186 start_codon:yes stop_codon:yes gene_type:complete